MKKKIIGSGGTIILSCMLVILACAIFVDYSEAAVKGTTSRKAQTVKVSLKRGVALVTMKDKNSWVFSQIQMTGKNKKGTPVAGVSALSKEGKKTTYVVPVKRSGKYFLYFHGVNKGASYSVRRVKAGGKLRFGKAVRRTSFIDDSTVVWYKVKVPKSGTLRVTVKDASCLYPGYSKVRLRRGKTLLSEEEYLIDGLGMSTVYGVRKGTYRIGVRSSSEVYRIKATYRHHKTTKGGKRQKKAVRLKRGKTARFVMIPGKKSKGWYRIVLPKKAKGKKKYTLTISAANNNVDIYGGINFATIYKKPGSGKNNGIWKSYLLNNNSVKLNFKTSRKGRRTIYIRVNNHKGASGLASIRFDRA